MKRMQNMTVILASGSPRRRELLEQIGIQPIVRPSGIEEKVASSVPEEVVMELSLQKAEDVAVQAPEHTLILGADTVVAVGREILGKPESHEDAAEMIRKIGGRSHQVYTGVTLIYKGEKESRGVTFAEKTEVQVYPLTEEEITEAAVRAFTARYLLGLFDGSEFDEIPYEKVECREHLMVAERLTRESVVLLKNDGVLPLAKKEGQTIGVIGPNANSREALIGNYHGTSSRYITVLEGIQDYVGDCGRVLYSEGCHLFQDRVENLAREDDRIAEAVTVARHSDVVVLCVGLNETLEGEEGDTGNSYASGDKEDLRLPKPQRKLMDAVLAVGKPVVLCLMAGSAIDLCVAQESAAAVVQLWYPGARGGRAVADILFGVCSPSGKLPVTFYRSLEGMPDFEDYSMQGRTYRYMTQEALYPFGYGLTYGDVRVERAEVVSRKEDSRDMILRVELVNEGSCPTQDVVQIYVKDTESADATPNPCLCAFKRVMLQAGERLSVEVCVPGEAFRVVNEAGERVWGSGKYRLYAGTGQPDRRTEELTGKKSVEIDVVLQEFDAELE